MPAPISSDAVAARVIMLWACTAEDCLKYPATWRATSWLLPASVDLPKGSTGPSQTADDSSHASAPSAKLDWTSNSAVQLKQNNLDTDMWGASADAWGSPTSAAPPATTPSPHSVFDYKDLERALDSYQHSDKPSQNSKGKQADAAALPQPEQKDSCCLDVTGSQLPGFYLKMVPEAAAMKADMSAEDQHVAELLAAYTAANPEVLTTCCTCVVHQFIAALIATHVSIPTTRHSL